MFPIVTEPTMDPAIVVAVVSVATAVVTSLSGIAVAVITNRRESEAAADETMDLVMAQRLVLKDEQIDALEQKVRNRDDRLAHVTQQRDALRVAVGTLRAQVENLGGVPDA